jgi:hypothetical protein
MTEKKFTQRIWQTRESGLVIPQGTVSDLSVSSSQTYLAIKENAIAVEELYAASKVPLPPTSDLANLIADAKALSDAWLTGHADKLSMTVLFRVGLLDRITAAVLPLRDVLDRSTFLSALTSGSLDLLDRKRSRAKDILWELEFWSMLKRRSFNASLEEPPDIVVNFEDLRIGVACKKLYSDRHVQNVLSQAVAQVEPTFDFGIVAISIDDLLPPNQILRTPSQGSMRRYIGDLNARFVQAHERHFRRYLGSGRLISAFVSTSVLADVYRERTRFNNAQQSTVWTIPGLSIEKAQALRMFYDRFMG